MVRNEKGQFVKGFVPTTAFKKGHISHWKGKKRYFKDPEGRKKKISDMCKKVGVGKWAVGNKNALGKHWKIKDTSKMRHTAWNKTEIYKNCLVCGNKFKVISCRLETNKLCSKECFNKNKSKYSGENSSNWQGGITPINNTIRGSLEYKLWSDSVWNRDGNCCQKCGCNFVSKLVAHHILNFSKYIELRFAIDNGITFCRECHKEFHKKYGKKNNSREQVKEFINICNTSATNQLKK